MTWQPMAAEGLFWFSTFANAVRLAGTVANLATAPRLEGAGVPVGGATLYPALRPYPRSPVPVRVSLLIPARNEADNLAILLPMLAHIPEPDLEILILDDDSGDATGRLVRAAGARVRLIQGRPLPEGWLGKNWACAQLAAEAAGDVLIFCDADVRVGPEAVAATLSRMRRDALDSLTCLPRQVMGTWSEKAVLPVLLFMPLLGFLPIALVQRWRWPALSAGCGQWFAFTRGAYERLGGHASVRREVVEDMALGRRVKQKGMRLGVAISTRFLATRMYTDFRSLWDGFAKNLVFLTGTGWLRPLLLLGFFTTVDILPWALALLGHREWLLPLSLWSASRLLCAFAFREPFSAWLWSPLGTLLIPLVALASWRGKRKGSLRWKGRLLELRTGWEGEKA